MENASRALLIAAGVLISVLILSLAAYLYSTFNASAKDSIKQMEQTKTTSFNGQFLAYQDKDDLTYFDVLNIVNIARNANKKNEVEEITDSDLYVKVLVKGVDFTDVTRTNYETFASKSSKLSIAPSEIFVDGTHEMSGKASKELKKYKCNSISYNNSGRINKIEIVEN